MRGTVLLPSGGNHSSRSLIAHLHTIDLGVVAIDAGNSFATDSLVDVLPCPRTSDPAYLPFIESLLATTSIDYVLPGTMVDTSFFAECKLQLEATYDLKVLTSKAAVVALAEDKAACMARVSAAGLGVPRFLPVTDASSFADAARELGYPAKLFCVKPAQGVSGSGRGFRIIDDRPVTPTTLLAAEVLPQLSYASALELFGSGGLPPYLAMEFLPGREFSVYLLCKQGQVLASTCHLRKKLFLMNSLEAEVVDAPHVTVLATQLCELFGFDYLINIQLKEDDEGKLKLVEINPRIAGSVMLAVAAGVDLVSSVVDLSDGLSIAPCAPAYGTRMVRYFTEEFLRAERLGP